MSSPAAAHPEPVEGCRAGLSLRALGNPVVSAGAAGNTRSVLGVSQTRS
jgi:hypothetical protein